MAVVLGFGHGEGQALPTGQFDHGSELVWLLGRLSADEAQWLCRIDHEGQTFDLPAGTRDRCAYGAGRGGGEQQDHALVRELTGDADLAAMLWPGGDDGCRSLMMMRGTGLRAQTPPQHPTPEQHDHDATADLQPPDRIASKGFTPDVQGRHRDADDHQAVGQRRRQAEQHRVRPTAVDADQIGGGHGLGVPRFEGVQGAKADGDRQVGQGNGSDAHGLTSGSC